MPCLGEAEIAYLDGREGGTYQLEYFVYRARMDILTSGVRVVEEPNAVRHAGKYQFRDYYLYR